MERGVTDEGFVQGAFHILESGCARWIANQNYFNGHDSDTLEPSVKAALITATNIYVQNNILPESAVEEALNIQTCGNARKFIDRYSENIRSPKAM